jgi:hypothetical protein
MVKNVQETPAERARSAPMAMARLRNDYPDVLHTGLEARLAIRRNEHEGPTSGLAPGFVQANLAILPKVLAEDFLRFCQLNPKPCPLVGGWRAGRSAPTGAGRGPRYPDRLAALSRLEKR